MEPDPDQPRTPHRGGVRGNPAPVPPRSDPDGDTGEVPAPPSHPVSGTGTDQGRGPGLTGKAFRDAVRRAESAGHAERNRHRRPAPRGGYTPGANRRTPATKLALTGPRALAAGFAQCALSEATPPGQRAALREVLLMTGLAEEVPVRGVAEDGAA